MNIAFQPDDTLIGINVNVANAYLNECITESEILRAISQVHANRAPGPDGIDTIFYKNTSGIIVPYLLKLFNCIFSSGQIPDSWGESIITPIHKAGSQLDPNNYRGISLINGLCKIFTCIINNRLQLWCQENSILDESQAGFRKKVFYNRQYLLFNGNYAKIYFEAKRSVLLYIHRFFKSL